MTHDTPRKPAGGPTHLFMLIALCFIFCGMAHGQDPVRMDEIGAGELLWKSTTGLIPLPALESIVELDVTGNLVHGKLTQRYLNPTDESIEAIYVFPLPEGAAVDEMEILIGDRRISSVVQERLQARITYEKAKVSGHKAALVDQSAGNLFTTAVANILPGEVVAVTLEYVDELSYRDGWFSLRFPLTFTPRYWPEGSHDTEQWSEEPTAQPLAQVTVSIDAGLRLQQVASLSHPIETDSQGNVYTITTPAGLPADRDFLLSWQPERSDMPLSSTFIEEFNGSYYALVMILPPLPDSDAGEGLPTETLFIIDVSGSMDGPSIRQARQALLSAIEKLRPEDRFNIIKFNHAFESFHDSFKHATATELEQTRRWIHGLRSGGGTEILPALVHGLTLMGESRSSHAQRIIFLTDGAIGNEQEIQRTIVERLGDTRLHTIGIGHAPNAYLMRKMARLGRGLCEFISSTSTAENRIDSFFSTLDRPVLADVTVEWDGLEATDVYPANPPDLYAGEPLLLSARLGEHPPAGSVRVSGYSRDGWFQDSVTLGVASDRQRGPATRWARARVDSHLDSLHEGAVPETVRSDVIELAMAFKLVTPYTSLVAVEEAPSNAGPLSSVRLGQALPQGATSNRLRTRIGLALIAAGLCLSGVIRLLRL